MSGPTVDLYTHYFSRAHHAILMYSVDSAKSGASPFSSVLMEVLKAPGGHMHRAAPFPRNWNPLAPTLLYRRTETLWIIMVMLYAYQEITADITAMQLHTNTKWLTNPTLKGSRWGTVRSVSRLDSHGGATGRDVTRLGPEGHLHYTKGGRNFTAEPL